MSADDNRLSPRRDQSRDILALVFIITDDGFSEHCAAEMVSDCAIRAFPHGFKFKLLYPLLVGSDGSALDSHLIKLTLPCKF